MVKQFPLFISSYSFLFIILLIKYLMNLWNFFGFIGFFIFILIVIVVIILLIFKSFNFINYKKFKQDDYRCYKVLKQSLKRDHTIVFIMTYLIPLIAFDLSNIFQLVSFCFFMLVVFLLGGKYNLFYFNPVYELKGRYYLVDLVLLNDNQDCLQTFENVVFFTLGFKSINFVGKKEPIIAKSIINDFFVYFPKPKQL